MDTMLWQGNVGLAESNGPCMGKVVESRVGRIGLPHAPGSFPSALTMLASLSYFHTMASMPYPKWCLKASQVLARTDALFLIVPELSP